MRPCVVLPVALAISGSAMACREPTAYVSPDAEVGTRVRLATFNVRRFFDTVCDTGACGPDDYEMQATPDAFAARADQLAAAITALDVDVIALQEVETQACLDALLVRLHDRMPNGVLGEIDSPASVDVAVLSKTPIDDVVRHRATHPLTLPSGAITTFSRELLEVHTRAANGAEVVMFAAHFKAKSNDQPDRRLAEAQVSSEIVNAVATARPGVLVVLGGDLNDTPGSPPLNALTLDGGLVRVADDRPLAAQATYTYGGYGQAIDHLLLAPGVASMRVPSSSRVWRDGYGWGGSDHAALTSEFLVP